MEKKELIRVKITDMSAEGSGIGKMEDGMTVFISGAVLGDLVEAEITKVKKNYALAECRVILERSSYRQERYCKWMDDCGGCGLGELKYEAQLSLKENQIRDKLIRIGGIPNPKINPIVSACAEHMTPPFHYRNKAVMAVGVDSDGNPLVGFRERKSGRVIDCDECKLQTPPAMAVANAVREYMRKFKVPAYDYRSGKGLLRNIIVKTAFGTGEVMVILVINGKELPHQDELIVSLDEAVYELNGTSELDGTNEPNGFSEERSYSLESVVININTSRNGEVLGEKTFVVAGKSHIIDRLSGLDFQVSPLSFYQVNPPVAELLYDKVMEYSGAMEGKTILDLYCGVGTMGIIAASRGAKKSVGVEVVPGAVLDANRNAVINGIVNAVFFTGKAENLISKSTVKSEENDSIVNQEYDKTLQLESFDTVILDPPRKGCDRKLIETIGESEINRIVYVSCNPGTLARDIKALSEYGFTPEEFTPFDMFPNTTEVETVCLLSRVY